MQKYRLSEQNTKFNKLFGKRILFFCAVFCLLGILLGERFSFSPTVCFVSGGVFLVVYLIFCRKEYAITALLLSVFFISIGGITLHMTSLDADYLSVNRSYAEGRVIEVSVTESGRSKYKIDHAKAGKNDLKHCVYVYTDNDDYKLGDVIGAYGEICRPSEKNYAYDFDARMYNASENVSLIIYAEFSEKVGEDATPIHHVRNFLAEKIDKLYADRAGIVKAMLIGMDDGMDRASVDAYREAGISHILCISGLHVSIIIAALSFILKKMRAGRIPTFIISAVFLIVYTLIAGASVSIIRAAVMNLLLLTAVFVSRRSDILTALSAAFLLCVIMNPAAVFGIGFQLSFGCVFAILCAEYIFSKNKIMSAVGASISALAAATLVLWNINHMIEPLTILLNLIAVPFSSVVLIVLLLSVLLFCVFGDLFMWTSIIGKFMIDILDRIAGLSENISMSIPVRAVPPVFILLVFFAVFCVSKYLIAPRWIKISCAAVILSAFIASMYLQTDQFDVRIDFIKHEYADTAVVSDADGDAILLDCGSPFGADYLAAYGMNCDYILLTADAKRSTGGIENYPDAEVYTAQEMQHRDVFCLNDDVEIEVYKKDGSDQADFLVRCNEENILLYMGRSPQDIDYPECRVLRLSSDGKKNIAFAGNSGAEYVILRERSTEIDAIAVNEAGVITVRYDGNLTVESEHDGRTISQSTEY